MNHKRFKKEITHGTIPLELNEKVNDEWKIKCPTCKTYHKENQFKWTDTDLEKIPNRPEYEVHSVTLLCPNCNTKNKYH